MAIYRYSSDSLLDEVRIVKNASGGLRAYLHARSDATPEQLADINATLLKRGMKTVPYAENGHPSLEVRGFTTARGFTKYLGQNGWVQGAPDVTRLASDKVTRKERMNNLTLKLAGFAYNLGDILYMTYTIKGYRNNKQKLRELEQAPLANAAEHLKALEQKRGGVRGSEYGIVGGIGYALGGIMLSGFASKDQSQNDIKTALTKIDRHLAKEGVTISADSSAHQVIQKTRKPLGQRIHDFISKYPSETLNTIYTGVGIFLAAASIKEVGAHRVMGKSLLSEANKHVRDDMLDIGLGTVTTASALAGLFIKEKKPVEGQPKKHGLARVWEWIQEKPLRATGYGFMVSTGIHAVATHGKYKSGDENIKQTVKFRAGFVIANIFAEVLLALSSKGHGQGVKADTSVEKTVIANTAEIIARQNPAEQDAMVERLAGYMASEHVLGIKAETIAAELRAQLAVMKTNPWAHTPQHSALAVNAEGTLVKAAPAKTTTPAAAKPETPATTITEATHLAHAKAAPQHAVVA